jgi:methylmalonyl-CoA mutase
VITSAPCDAATGLPDDVSRRLARHTVLILQEEAHLGRVIDPPGGSWYLDWLTRELAAKAWEVFQAVERLGGMYAALQNGWVAEQIESASAQRKEDIAREMVDVGEEPLAHPPPDYAALRTARASQISAMRRGSESLAALSSSKEKTAAAVEAASQGATIGQLANALAFHARPPFPSLAGRRLRRSRDEKGFDGRE